MIVLLVLTDGRRSCISRTIPSALEHLQGPITEYLISDDSGDPDYTSWLNRTFPEFDVVGGRERLGFGGNINRAWTHLRIHSDASYVFHLEDDFTFNRDVDLRTMVGVLDANVDLVQFALRRQPWNEVERAAGGVVESHPDAYTDCFNLNGQEWLEHRLFFTTNPSLYRRTLCARGWPVVDQSEGIFTHQLLKDPLVRFGFWGSRRSGEAVTHIGSQRVGSGY